MRQISFHHAWFRFARRPRLMLTRSAIFHHSIKVFMSVLRFDYGGLFKGAPLYLVSPNAPPPLRGRGAGLVCYVFSRLKLAPRGKSFEELGEGRSLRTTKAARA
eukprot:4376845-Pleurochrysis_carterae.AAC.1